MRAAFRTLILGLVVLAALLGVGCSDDPGLSVIGTNDPSTGLKAIPAGYYDSIDAATAGSLRASLHAVIDDHQRIPYTSTATDTWDVLEAADQDPADGGRILDLYLNASYPKYGAGNTDYNREHAWAKSYGFPNDGSSNYPYTDCHHLFLCNDSYNSSRSNKPFGAVGAGGSEYPTQANGGVGGGSGVYPGWSNWADPTYWEVWRDRRGDVARALFYMDVRYEGGTHGVTGHAEPDLVLTDNLAQITASNTGVNEAVAYMGLLSVLLQWHAEDPVDAREQARNDAVYSHQGNRNPFIDHPEWVECVFGGACGGGGGDTTPPAAPAGLAATGGDGFIGLDWADNGESDLAGYTVWRADQVGGPYTALNGSLLAASAYTDGGVAAGPTNWYVVTASDASGNESPQSAAASAAATGGGGGSGVAWINEFHYDNDGTDTGEFVEVAGPAGTSLAGWTVVGYNGNGGTVYATVALSGTLIDQAGGFGTADFAFAGMQNGSPDGLALVDDVGQVVQFISYEGLITAADGPAAGLVSVDVQVSEGSTSPVGWSLQLAGDGTSVAAFTWQPAAAATRGAVNNGQTFGGGTPNQAPTADAGGPYAAESGQAVGFTSAGSFDPDGVIVAWSWNFGDGASSTSADPVHTYSAAGVYTATVTVTDDGGAQDTASAQVTVTAPNQAPTADAGGPYAGLEDQIIAFSSGASFDGDGSIAAWSWNFGDGATSTAANPGHAYAAAGIYTVSLTVTDDDGAQDTATATATVDAPPPPPAAAAWINEFHYDNSGSDRNEFVEVAGTAGTDLTGWTVVAYNGSGGSAYGTKSLAGVIADQDGGFGTKAVAFSGLQNGNPDGIALVDGAGAVVQFLSYGGSFTASDGPAAGMTSTDIGITESSSTPRRYSLQLRGTGTSYADFTWTGPFSKSDGKVNAGQSFAPAGLAVR
jgi:endonuclease I/PKD repeat protein